MTETPESTLQIKSEKFRRNKNTWNMMAQRIGNYHKPCRNNGVSYAVLIGIASCHSAWSDIYYPAKDYLW